MLALSALFAALFCEDPKALLTPLLLSYFCAGSDGIHSYGEAVQAPAAFFQPAGLVNMFIAGAIIVASVLFRIIASGILADVFRRRGLLTFGLLCMAAAFLLNGAFSSAVTGATDNASSKFTTSRRVTEVTKVPYRTVWLFSAFLPSLASLKYERLSGFPTGFGLRAEPPDSRRL